MCENFVFHPSNHIAPILTICLEIQHTGDYLKFLKSVDNLSWLNVLSLVCLLSLLNVLSLLSLHVGGLISINCSLGSSL